MQDLRHSAGRHEQGASQARGRRREEEVKRWLAVGGKRWTAVARARVEVVLPWVSTCGGKMSVRLRSGHLGEKVVRSSYYAEKRNQVIESVFVCGRNATSPFRRVAARASSVTGKFCFHAACTRRAARGAATCGAMCWAPRGRRQTPPTPATARLSPRSRRWASCVLRAVRDPADS